MLYVAYGSNINKSQMNFRVPGAKPYGKGIVYNWQLDFHGKDGNGYATLTQSPGHKVPVVLWEMSDKQESVMDRYEGYPTAYYKKKIPVHVNGQKMEGTVYIMNEERRVARPSRKYVNTVRIGYESFGLDLSYLQEALERNSKEYYLDDLLEVREFKPFKKPVVTTVIKKGKKSKSKSKVKSSTTAKDRFEFKWSKQEHVNDVPGELAGYMRKTFPDDPYWGTTYAYEDDYSADYYSGTKKPSLDDYDYYGDRLK